MDRWSSFCILESSDRPSIMRGSRTRRTSNAIGRPAPYVASADASVTLGERAIAQSNGIENAPAVNYQVAIVIVVCRVAAAHHVEHEETILRARRGVGVTARSRVPVDGCERTEAASQPSNLAGENEMTNGRYVTVSMSKATDTASHSSSGADHGSSTQRDE
eukprot:7377257-Prymnesium_polylepis.1